MEEAEGDDEEKETKESRRPKKKTCTIDCALDMCEEHKVTPDKAILRTLVRLTEDEAKGLLKREQKLMESTSRSTWNDPPRSGSRRLTESRDHKPATNGQTFAAAICR